MRNRLSTLIVLLSLLALQAASVLPVQASILEEPGSTGKSVFFPLIMTQAIKIGFRNGQTFISWAERAELQGEVYRVYRSSREITGSNFSGATRIAEVGKNSAAFYENRFNDCKNGVCTWRARYTDRLIVDNNGAPVQDGWGLVVWTPAASDFGGAISGSSYYAITFTPQGGGETFDSTYSTGPISETVSDPLPVEIPNANLELGGHAYIQYMDLREWNPTFHAPNATNHYYGLDPNDPTFANALQYAYDYAVFTPSEQTCGGSIPEKLPVLVIMHGWKDFEYKVPPGAYPDLPKYCAYTIYPTDVTNTWYFGFARNHDYRQGGDVASGDVIVNYTEQRILRMVYDLMRNPPGPGVDSQRIYAAGQSMGGTGALAMAERYPNVFAATYASQPMTNFRNNTQKWIDDARVKWGNSSLNLPISLNAPNGWAKPLEKYNGKGVWDWQNLQWSLTGRSADTMAPFGIIHSSLDTVIDYASQAKPIYSALNSSHRAYGGMVTGSAACFSSNCHEWMYYIGLPPSLAPLGGGKYSWIPFQDLQVVKNESNLGFSNFSGNSPLHPGSTGTYAETLKWSPSWDPWNGATVDETDFYQTSICITSSSSSNCAGTGYGTVDVTLWRLQHFSIGANQRFFYRNRHISDGVIWDEGTIYSNGNGILTIPGLQVSGGGTRLTVTPY